MEKRVPFTAIESDRRFALFCKAEGLVSAHDKASEAMRALAAHLNLNPNSGCRIYERTVSGWDLVL